MIFSDAMKLGRPIIAMPVGDLPALHAQAAFGVMAARIDAAALADAIRAALRRSALDFGSSTRLHAAHFDLASIADKIVRELCPDA